MYKNNIIVFFVLILLWISLSFYFTTQKDSLKEQYKEKKELLTKYNALKIKYSKDSLKVQKKKIFEFLNAFGIKYDLKKTKRGSKEILNIKLQKSNANKIISYILNSNIEIYTIKIKKIDLHNLSFEVIFQ